MKKLILAFIALLTLAGSAYAQLGSLSADLVFTPVTPCRILDTRNAGTKSGILQANTVRGFWGWNTTFATQGGSATPCNTLNSTNEAAILVNFTVVTPDTAGYITAFPADVSDANRPLAATVNFTAGSVVGNNATIKLNQTGTGDDFKIYSTSNVHVVADIVGYYSKPVSVGSLECSNTLNQTSTFAPNAYSGLIQGTACAAGYTLLSTQCSYFSGELGVNVAKNELGYCAYNNTTANTKTVYIQNTCCRIPGR